MTLGNVYGFWWFWVWIKPWCLSRSGAYPVIQPRQFRSDQVATQSEKESWRDTSSGTSFAGMSIWLGISQTPWPDGLFWRRSSLLWHTLTVEFSSPCRGVQQFPMFCKRGSCSVWAFLEDGLDRYPLQREREREKELRIYLFGNIYADTFFFHWSLFWFASHTGTSYSFLRAFCRVVQLVELNWSKIEFQE